MLGRDRCGAVPSYCPHRHQLQRHVSLCLSKCVSALDIPTTDGPQPRHQVPRMDAHIFRTHTLTPNTNRLVSPNTARDISELAVSYRGMLRFAGWFRQLIWQKSGTKDMTYQLCRLVRNPLTQFCTLGRQHPLGSLVYHTRSSRDVSEGRSAFATIRTDVQTSLGMRDTKCCRLLTCYCRI